MPNRQSQNVVAEFWETKIMHLTARLKPIVHGSSPEVSATAHFYFRASTGYESTRARSTGQGHMAAPEKEPNCKKDFSTNFVRYFFALGFKARDDRANTGFRRAALGNHNFNWPRICEKRVSSPFVRR